MTERCDGRAQRGKEFSLQQCCVGVNSGGGENTRKNIWLPIGSHFSS